VVVIAIYGTEHSIAAIVEILGVCRFPKQVITVAIKFRVPLTVNRYFGLANRHILFITDLFINTSHVETPV
jgi:hypothetical protein